MKFENDVRKRIEQSDFAKNCGRVIRTINVLSGEIYQCGFCMWRTE